MAKKRYRDFEEVVRQIARSEKDVDKVLEAAKLQRVEHSSFWDNVDFPEIVLGLVLLTVALMIPLMFVLTILVD